MPTAFRRFGLKAPIYATIPVYTMGQMFLYDAHQAQVAVRDFTAYTLDDVDEVFASIKQLKYSQHLRLGGKCKGIVVTPYAAGRSLGGTVWKIAKEAEEVIKKIACIEINSDLELDFFVLIWIFCFDLDILF